MQTENPATLEPTRNTTAEDQDLNDAIRSYVRTFALWHGRPQSVRSFGVSRHTLWRFLERGHLGRSLFGAVTKAVFDAPDIMVAVAWAITSTRQIR